MSYNGQKVSQTSLVGWNASLLEMLAQIPQAGVTGITRLERRREPGPSWALRRINALWAPSPREPLAVGPLLFKLDDDPQVRDSSLLPVPDESGRRLLYTASLSLARGL